MIDDGKTHDESSSEPDANGSLADTRLAELLAETDASSTIRERLREQGSTGDGDLLARVNALDFVDSVVGGIADMPEQLGDFRITGLLGRGGMGTVFEAYQQSLDRHVALKVLSPMFSADVKMRQRFRAEAKATAALHHQHIVPIYGYGEAAGVLYFAMEKVDGVSLDKHIAAARHRGKPLMKPEEAARRFAGVADALAHAHRRRLLHRDVKPGNLLVSADGTLSLADFGLSKVLGQVSMSVTVGGAFLGTLHYAPPEQAKGQSLTPASDLYALGVTMFEALTNELPLKGDSTEAMLHELLHGTPRRLRSLAPNVPKDLAAVVDKLLQKDPADRYTDGEELARDLMRVADGEPVRIRRLPLITRLWRRAKRNPGQAAAVVLVTGLLGVSGWLALQTLQLGQSKEKVERLSQGETKIQEFLSRAMWEAGEAAGPGRLFRVLTGSEGSSPTTKSELLTTLDEAAKLLPEDLRTRNLRDAYIENPHPEATDFLNEGHGFRAMQELDRGIEDVRRDMQRQTRVDVRTDENWLKLYRLYLARAVAALTGAVGQPERARLDLVRASMVRPGAFFPKVLQAFLDWQPRDGVPALTATLQALIDDGPPEARWIVAALAKTVAGLRRMPTAQMMNFDLAYGQRRELERFAQGLDGQPYFGGSRTGTDGVVLFQAKAALQLKTEPKLAQGVLETARFWLEHVAADSPLQGWHLVLDVLDSGTCSRNLSMATRIRGWLDLLRLQPDPEYVRRWIEPDVRDLIARHPDARGIPELGARLEESIGQQRDALAWAERWYQDDTSDPEAAFCKFRAQVRGGQVDDAAYTLALVLQKADDPRSYRTELSGVLREQVRAGGALAPQWAALRAALRSR